jgi:hypothetical protein
MSWVVNIRHCLTEEGYPAPGVSGKHAMYYGRMVQAASVHEVNEPFISAIDCDRRPGHKPCKGKIGMVLHDDGVIQWLCDCCEFNGLLSGWQGTMWDLSHTKKPTQRENNRILDVSEEEYKALRDIITSSQEVDALIAGAAPVPDDEILLLGTCEAFDLLSGDLAFAVNHEKNRKKMMLLDGILEKIEASLNEGAGFEDGLENDCNRSWST